MKVKNIALTPKPERCLWTDGGDNYFWLDRDEKPSGNYKYYSHSSHCPCRTGKRVEWEWRGTNYVPVGSYGN